MKLIMRISNGVCFPYDEYKHLEGTDGYRVIDEGETVIPPRKETEEEPPIPVDWMEKIIEAVKQIDPETYSKPIGGRPAMPKVDAVATLLGEAVTAVEIAAAVAAIGKNK